LRPSHRRRSRQFPITRVRPLKRPQINFFPPGSDHLKAAKAIFETIHPVLSGSEQDNFKKLGLDDGKIGDG
jgi:hypothetical protein